MQGERRDRVVAAKPPPAAVADAAAGPVGTQAASSLPSAVGAFFDFDHTLLAGDAGVVFGKNMAAWAARQATELPTAASRMAFYARLGVITGSIAVEAGTLRALNAARIVKRSTLIRAAYKHFRGLPIDPVIERMGVVFEEKLAARIYPEIRAILNDHLAKGHKVAIVSTGPRMLIAHAKSILGDNVDVLGVELHEENGRFTGTVEGPLWGMEKREIMEAYAKEHGIDLAQSYAYSDHHSDLPFLQAVGHPVVVNPTHRLRAVARQRGWLVIEPARPVERLAARHEAEHAK
ncbi:MAG: HAD family hydrolase [Thermoplasmatota archaeon]